MYKNQISFKLMKKFSGSSAGEKEDLSKKEDFEKMTYLVLITKEFLRKFLLE